jgi:uncharacterized phage protein gp47/JayE
MADFPSTPDLIRIARDEILTKNAALTKDILDRAGSDANALMAASVAVADAVVGQLIRVSASLAVATAKGADLDRILFDRYGLVRKDAAPALGTVQISLPAPASSNFAIPEGTQFRTSDNKLFASTAQRTFLAGSSGPLNVPVASVLAGLNQQARSGTITSIVDTIAGAPSGLTVTNALATSGVADAELDEAFRARGKLFYSTARRGTLGAIEAGALAVAGVETARAFEVVDPSGISARLVNLVVADAFTQQLVNATSVPGSYETQSQALADAVIAGLLDVRAAGIQVVVQVANVDLVGVTLGLRFREGVDVDTVSAAARAAVVSHVNSLNPGEPLVIADLEEALSVVPGIILLGGEVIAPTLDVTNGATTAFRTSDALVVVTAEA